MSLEHFPSQDAENSPPDLQESPSDLDLATAAELAAASQRLLRRVNDPLPEAIAAAGVRNVAARRILRSPRVGGTQVQWTAEDDKVGASPLDRHVQEIDEIEDSQMHPEEAKLHLPPRRAPPQLPLALVRPELPNASTKLKRSVGSLGQFDGVRKRHKFSQQEENYIREGIKRFKGSTNIWKDIFTCYPFHQSRKPTDLKDKWRNMK